MSAIAERPSPFTHDAVAIAVAGARHLGRREAAPRSAAALNARLSRCYGVVAGSAVFAVKLQTTSTNRLGKPGVLTTMARLSQWALENGYLDSERGKDSSEPSGDQPGESGAAPGPRSNS